MHVCSMVAGMSREAGTGGWLQRRRDVRVVGSEL